MDNEILKEILAELKGHSAILQEHSAILQDHSVILNELKTDMKEVKRKVGSIEEQTANLLEFRTETSTALEKVQYDINYLVRKTATHDDDIIQLKKAK